MLYLQSYDHGQSSIQKIEFLFKSCLLSEIWKEQRGAHIISKHLQMQNLFQF
jgi:hypothetical protein